MGSAGVGATKGSKFNEEIKMEERIINTEEKDKKRAK